MVKVMDQVLNQFNCKINHTDDPLVLSSSRDVDGRSCSGGCTLDEWRATLGFYPCIRLSFVIIESIITICIVLKLKENTKT